jgi:hypothetical protein
VTVLTKEAGASLRATQDVPTVSAAKNRHGKLILSTATSSSRFKGRIPFPPTTVNLNFKFN